MDLTAREKEEEKKRGKRRSGNCEGLLKSLNCILGVC
jgi:hypothetical protein